MQQHGFGNDVYALLNYYFQKSVLNCKSQFFQTRILIDIFIFLPYFKSREKFKIVVISLSLFTIVNQARNGTRMVVWQEVLDYNVTVEKLREKFHIFEWSHRRTIQLRTFGKAQISMRL
jgi:hypothetical protein